MSIDTSCKERPNMDDAVWDELLEHYDMDNPDYQTKREMADEFMEKIKNI